MKVMKFGRALVCTAAILAILGCGGDDGQGPAPVATATPTPSPTPTPTPTPPSSLAIANVEPGGRLQTKFVCAGIPNVTRTDNRITAIGQFAPPPFLSGYQSLEYVEKDRFIFDNNGFGGSTFDISDKRPPVSSGHDLYVHVGFGPSPSEFQLWNAVGSGALEYATVGMLAEEYDGGSLCFFAAGAAASQIPTSNVFDHLGRIDGLSQFGGQTRRLQGSEFSLKLDYAARKGTIEITLVTCDDEFGDLSACPKKPLGKIAGEVTLSGNSIRADLAGPDGITGRLEGQFFSTLALGAGFVFTLTDTAGRKAIGAAGGDLRQI